jgi:hypothetical protein
MKWSKLALSVMAVLVLVSFANIQLAAQEISLTCGDILEAEVTQAKPDERNFDHYKLDIPAGTNINLTVSPLGDTFNVGIVLQDSAGNDILIINSEVEGASERLVDFKLGSSNQILRIAGVEPGSTESDSAFYATYGYLGRESHAGYYFGAYEIRLGCSLRDGRIIEPGESADAGGGTGGGQPQPTAPVAPAFGFPGLAPVDFAAAFRLPLAARAVSEGEIPPVGSAILGFYFTGEVGDTFDIAFERTSGNLNLGLVLLSADNQVAYMAALVSSQTMSTRLTLPASGEYTLGIFRIDLIPPPLPAPTRFKLTGTLNP